MKGLKIIVIVLALGTLAAVLAHFAMSNNVAVLNPAGPIGASERNLIQIATFLMLTVVIPVFVLTATFAWRYRASNTKAKYTPNWEHSRFDEAVWWLVPFVIIAILAAITWKSTHDLDPYKPLDSNVKPLTVQVVALDWKWLFIYPKEGIATVNVLEIPTNTPINFQITSDAPMNSFWIPQLGGQIYAMPGMMTQLHLMADKTGNYDGYSANISGEGFSGMHFVTQAVSQNDFASWVAGTQSAGSALTNDVYTELSKPSENDPPQYYGSVAPDLFGNVVMKFMMPQGATGDMHDMPGMKM